MCSEPPETVENLKEEPKPVTPEELAYEKPSLTTPRVSTRSGREVKTPAWLKEYVCANNCE